MLSLTYQFIFILWYLVQTHIRSQTIISFVWSKIEDGTDIRGLPYHHTKWKKQLPINFLAVFSLNFYKPGKNLSSIDQDNKSKQTVIIIWLSKQTDYRIRWQYITKVIKCVAFFCLLLDCFNTSFRSSPVGELANPIFVLYFFFQAEGHQEPFNELEIWM